MTSHSFKIIYEAAEGGGYCAHVPSLGLTTEGSTLRQTKLMAHDAIEGLLEAAKLLGKRVAPTQSKRVAKRRGQKER